MDIHHHDVPVRRDQISPTDIDAEALAILRDAGFRWDIHALAFRRGQVSIEYRFLREQKLAGDVTLARTERIGQLQRLRILVQSID